jgi:hypothetical protein
MSSERRHSDMTFLEDYDTFIRRYLAEETLAEETLTFSEYFGNLIRHSDMSISEIKSCADVCIEELQKQRATSATLAEETLAEKTLTLATEYVFNNQYVLARMEEHKKSI